MGGDLFKLGRLPREDYLTLEAELRVYLDDRLGDQYRIPRYYGDKPDFGDLDIVVSEAAIDATWDRFMQQTIEDLGVTQHARNPAVFSTVWREFQVDYFLRPEQYFESTYNFLCYNDLGNVLGRIFRRLNLKYGERGLEYVFRRDDDGSYKQVLTVSVDMDRILELIELDSTMWHTGFDTLDAMFSWVTASPWFTADPYLDPNSPVSKRATTRPTMQKFLPWLEENPPAATQRLLEHRDDALKLIARAFPEAGLLDAIERERAREARANVVRAKFSGKVVMALFPALEGKQLGEFIRTFKESFDDVEAELADMSPEAIELALRRHHAAGYGS